MFDIYLDIDGVLLANEKHSALHVDKFVQKIVDTGAKIHWLTTWCRGSAKEALAYLKTTDMRPDTISLLEANCLVTDWHTAKTEAIDFTKPFLWFDDDLYDDEKDALLAHGLVDSWIEVDLAKNPNQLTNFVDSFPLPTKKQANK